MRPLMRRIARCLPRLTPLGRRPRRCPHQVYCAPSFAQVCCRLDQYQRAGEEGVGATAAAAGRSPRSAGNGGWSALVRDVSRTPLRPRSLEVCPPATRRDPTMPVERCGRSLFTTPSFSNPGLDYGSRPVPEFRKRKRLRHCSCRMHPIRDAEQAANRAPRLLMKRSGGSGSRNNVCQPVIPAATISRPLARPTHWSTRPLCRSTRPFCFKCITKWWGRGRGETGPTVLGESFKVGVESRHHQDRCKADGANACPSAIIIVRGDAGEQNAESENHPCACAFPVRFRKDGSAARCVGLMNKLLKCSCAPSYMHMHTHIRADQSESWGTSALDRKLLFHNV